MPDVDILLGVPHIVAVDNLLNLLPPKSDMDRYVATWFNIMEQTRGMVIESDG